MAWRFGAFGADIITGMKGFDLPLSPSLITLNSSVLIVEEIFLTILVYHILLVNRGREKRNAQFSQCASLPLAKRGENGFATVKSGENEILSSHPSGSWVFCLPQAGLMPPLGLQPSGGIKPDFGRQKIHEPLGWGGSMPQSSPTELRAGRKKSMCREPVLLDTLGTNSINSS